MTVFLKTIFSNEAEKVFILAQIVELVELVDRFIIIEPEFTHTGRSRQLIGMDWLFHLLPEMSRKIDYLPLLITDEVRRFAQSSYECHKNEEITRKGFLRYYNFSAKDIIISTDADETLYRASINRVLSRVQSKVFAWKAECLALHQFFYQDDLIALDYKFRAPSVIGYGRYLLGAAGQHWRYVGRRSDEIAGCHFSWCMPPEALELKLNSFAHAPEYTVTGLSPKDKIENDIRSLVYSFRDPVLKLRRCTEAEVYWPEGYKTAKKLLEKSFAQ